jgi:very-short-patch-repair endonuclease
MSHPVFILHEMTRDYADVACRQHALVTTMQMVEHGYSARQVYGAARSGLIIRVRPHVYRIAGAPVTWEQAFLAAVLSVGRGAVLSHTTAAALWQLRHSDRDHAGLHLMSEHRIQANGVTAHQTVLPPWARAVFSAIPVTTVERTIIDLAGTLSPTQLGQCVDDAMRRGLLRLERLRQQAAQVAPAHRRPIEPVRRILADRIPGYRPDDSDFETRMNRMWDRLGLPHAERQFPVTVDGTTYRLDRAIVAEKIGTEWDSYRYHNATSDRDYDSNRRARLVGAGWLIVPVTANTEPELVARAVLRAYQDRVRKANVA